MPLLERVHGLEKKAGIARDAGCGKGRWKKEKGNDTTADGQKHSYESDRRIEPEKAAAAAARAQQAPGSRSSQQHQPAASSKRQQQQVSASGCRLQAAAAAREEHRVADPDAEGRARADAGPH